MSLPTPIIQALQSTFGQRLPCPGYLRYSGRNGTEAG